MARVLIHEPHEDIAALLELIVRRLGHEPVHCACGELADTRVGAAVIEPGEEEGLRAARLLREAGVPVIFTSIYPPDDRLLDLGPAAYLVKPFPLSRLARELAVALAGRALPADVPGNGARLASRATCAARSPSLLPPSFSPAAAAPPSRGVPATCAPPRGRWCRT